MNAANRHDRNIASTLKQLSLDAEERKAVKYEQEKSELRLSHLCRDVIREHLLELDTHKNLFVRVPRLGLPAGLARYLVFDMSLNGDDKHGNGHHGIDDDSEEKD